MAETITIGLDIAKSVFQVHGVDAAGTVVLRRQLRRAEVLAFFSRVPPCLVGLEACGSAHHWARHRNGTHWTMPPRCCSVAECSTAGGKAGSVTQLRLEGIAVGRARPAGGILLSSCAVAAQALVEST